MSSFSGTYDTDHDEPNVEGERNRRDDQCRTANVLFTLSLGHDYSKDSLAMRNLGGVSNV